MYHVCTKKSSNQDIKIILPQLPPRHECLRPLSMIDIFELWRQNSNKTMYQVLKKSSNRDIKIILPQLPPRHECLRLLYV